MIGEVLESKYELVGRLGEGGMGAVYRARRIHIGDEVAVKVLHMKYVAEPAALERFRREARAAAVLHHPNVVGIYDFGEARGDNAPAFIVMELVVGRSLRQLLAQEGRLAPIRAVSMMQAICAGVGAAHRRNIIHRDLKPDNIIILPPEAEGERETAKVVDFGIAKLRDMASDQNLTQTGAVIGTPYYMSPEQCRAAELDARSDVYSLGAMLYEMLSGAPPFTSESVTGVVAKHLIEPPPPMQPGLGVPAGLEAVVMRSLAKDPSARPADATALAKDLQAAVPFPFAQSGAPVLTPQAPAFHDPAAQGYRSGPVTPYATPSPVPPQTSPQAAYVTAASSPKGSRAGLIAGGSAALVLIVIFGVVVVWKLGQNQSGTANLNVSAGVSNQNSSTGSANTNSGVQRGSVPSGTDAMSLAESKLLNGGTLSRNDLAGLSTSQLSMLRNTVFARYGRSFSSPELQRHFNSQPWYRPNASYSDSSLTSVDKANVALISSAEGITSTTGSATGSVGGATVEQSINGWAAALTAHDLDRFMSYYADPLETYYERSGVSLATVRADKARAFNAFSEMEMRVNKLSFEVEPSGARATAMFDKSWTFQGSRRTSGSVRQLLILINRDGRWLIKGEKDLIVYPAK